MKHKAITKSQKKMWDTLKSPYIRPYNKPGLSPMMTRLLQEMMNDMADKSIKEIIETINGEIK